MERNEYTHGQLSKPKREIRLLTLHGSDISSAFGEAVVRGSIRTVSLDDKPSYYALSYTWGKGSFTEALVLDQSYIPITESLYEALQHLQHLEGIHIWIDQICINQADNDEKSWQVQMMKQIYTLAAKVIVWLGPEHDGGEMALRQLSALGAVALLEGQKQHDNEWAFQNMCRELVHNSERIQQRRGSVFQGRNPLRGITNMPTDLVHSLLSTTGNIEGDDVSSFERCLDFVPYFEVDYDALVSLIKRPWWSRVWVLQEFSSNPNTVFLCGKVEAHADHVLLAYMLLRMTDTEGARPDKQIRWDWGRNINTFAGERARGFGSYQHEGPGSERFQKFTLHTTLMENIMGGFRATDARDYVFGILGCCSDTEELGLEANYSISPAGVYTETTFALLNNGWMQILAKRDWVPSIQGLPSWVPDFSAAQDSTEHHLDKYSAGGHRFRVITYLGDLSNGSATLRLVGFHVSKIKSVLDYDTGVLNTRTTLKDRIDHLDRWCTNALYPLAREAWNRNPIYGSLKDTEQAIVRAVVGDEKWLHGHDVYCQLRALDSAADGFFPPRHSLEYDGDSPFSDSKRLLAIWAPVVGKKHRIFLTEDGHIGLATKEIVEGDTVVIFESVPTPLILRETSNSRPDKLIYQRISSAYAHGIMRGELVEANLGQRQMISIV